MAPRLNPDALSGNNGLAVGDVRGLHWNVCAVRERPLGSRQSQAPRWRVARARELHLRPVPLILVALRIRG